MAEDRTAFVLAGGGSLGAVQAGMLTELMATGVKPDFIVGVSAGALNGAFLAFDPSATMVDLISQLWRRITTREALSFSWRSLYRLLGFKGHLSEAEGLIRLLERELPYRTFDATRIPLHIVASDEVTGAEVVLDSGEVIPAVLASTAIPGMFPPVTIGGRRLVDGVIATGTPISTAARLGATRLIVLPCGFTCVEHGVPRHALGRAMHAINLLGARQLRQDFERYQDALQLRIVPPLCPQACSPLDYSKGSTLIEAARLSTRRWLDEHGLEREGFPQQLAIHSHS